MATKDTLAATTSAKDALCGYLHTATLCSSDLDAIKTFYVDGMKMTLEGPIKITEEDLDMLRSHWDIPTDIEFDYYHLYRPTVPSLIHIRLLHLHSPTPHIHKSYSSRELGPFSLGFPNGDQPKIDADLKAKGIEAMAPMQVDEIIASPELKYPYWETIFKGPDFLHCVGIQRGEAVGQLSPIDPTNNYGGPGYSAFVTNDSDAELGFYTDVLDMELRADRIWEAAEDGALGIPAGVPFRFAIVYAKGTSQNHLLFLDYKDGVFEDPGVTPRVPNQGLGMWSFETRDLEEVIKRAKAKKIIVQGEPRLINDPIVGKVKAITLITPSNYLIEVFERG